MLAGARITASAGMVGAAPIATAAGPSPAPTRPWLAGGFSAGRLLPTLAAAIFGLGGGVWLASSNGFGWLADGAGVDKAAPPTLRLDTSTDALAARIARANALEATRVRR